MPDIHSILDGTEVFIKIAKKNPRFAENYME